MHHTAHEEGRSPAETDRRGHWQVCLCGEPRAQAQLRWAQRGVQRRPGRAERTDNWQHIVDCGTSILLHKWGYGPPGGSFVEAVAGNDLMGAFGRADWVNVRAIRFYCTLIHNTGLIE